MRRLIRAFKGGSDHDKAQRASKATEASNGSPAPANEAGQDAIHPQARNAPSSKHVAFSNEVSRLSAPLPSPDSDVQSLISRHGAPTSASGLACFPARHTPAEQPASTPVPSNPVRHPHLDRYDANATLRPGPVSHQRGDILRFANEAHGISASALQQRSTTSMSQATTASNASSSYGTGSQHNGAGLYGANAAYYPNLAVLATYARDMSVMTGGNSIVQHLTWSEITDDDLVENIGSRERTRQEVLFELCCSEERYVQELLVREHI